MLTTRKIPALLLPLALLACAPVEEPPAEEESWRQLTSDDPCGAGAYQQYVGQTSPQISLPAGTVVRHYRTGDPITMDMAPGRINFEYDRSGKLVKVTCG